MKNARGAGIFVCHPWLFCLLEQARNIAVPYLENHQSIKIEIHVASRPTQVWAYDYAAESWILQS